MTIGGSLFCITSGAILYFAVTAEPAGIDLQVVGVILMVIGAIGLVLGLVLLGSRRRAAASIEDRYR
jgi:Zn-dependent protease with chaperone function